MGHNVLIQWHVMVGYDFHTPPPPPAGQFTIMVLNGTSLTRTCADDHKSTQTGGKVMGRGTDIGPIIIPHAPAPPIPPFRLAYIIPTSGSKSHFGSSKYKINCGGATSCAVAVLFVVNLNLNCGEPVPTPTGVVIAPNTHMAGMTLGDFLAGIFSMVLDFVIQSLLNKYGARFAKGILRAISPKAAMALSRFFFKAATKIMGQSAGRVAYAAALQGAFLGLFVGSPLGPSISTITNLLGLPNTSAHDALRERTGIPSSEDIITGIFD